MKVLRIINESLAIAEGFLVSALLFFMILLAFLQVIMRDLFNHGLPWADTVVKHLVLWVGFVGATLAAKLEQNLTLEVLTKYLPERVKLISLASVKVFGSVICYFLFAASLRFLADERSTGELFLDLFPSWWVLIIIPITFLVIPFHFLVNFIQEIHALHHKRKHERKHA